MRLWIAVILLWSSVSGFSQNVIPFQTFSISAGGFVSGGGFKLTGSFGQPFISAGTQSTSGFKLERGFVPSIITFNTNFPPAIEFTTLSKIPATNIIQVKVTDIDGIERVVLYQRAISKNTFDSLTMELKGTMYEKTIPSGSIDAIGVEYYFAATDKTNNRAVLPTGKKPYFQSYTTADGAFVPQTVYHIGKKTNEYKIISMPFGFTNASIGQQFNELANADGQHSKSNFRLATYAGSGQWQEYPTPLNVFERGKGYWFLTTVQEELALTGASIAEEHQGKLFQLTLKPDWNQIGNPYPVTINWDDVIDFNDNPNVGSLKTFDFGFKDASELKPFEGAFVKYNGSSPVTISVPFKGQENTGGRKRRRIFSTDLNDDQWMLKLTLEDDVISSSVAAIGMHPEAVEAHDTFDDFYPPRFADYAELRFKNPYLTEDFAAKDIVSTQDAYSWTFTIDASSGEPLVLRWNNENLGENSKELYLFDEFNTQLISMRAVSSHVVRKSRAYRIFYGENVLREINPERIALGTLYPNPWVTGNAEGVTIPFTLPGKNKSYHVSMEVIDAQGRAIKQLISKQLPSGYHEASWDGRNALGEGCAPGFYLVRLQAAGNEEVGSFYNRLIIK